MKTFQVFFLPVLLMVIPGLSVNGENYWTYEINRIVVENHTPDIITLDLHKSRIARGVYAISGQVEINQDLTDEFRIDATVFMSRSGMSNTYVKTPFRLAPTKLSHFANKYYKTFLMEDLANCSDNFPIFETTMEMPMRKRTITFNNCELSTKPYPSHLIPGYYRVIIRYTNQADGWVMLETHVQLNN